MYKEEIKKLKKIRKILIEKNVDSHIEGSLEEIIFELQG